MSRKVWVSTTAFGGRCGPTREDNLALAARLLDRAATERPDVICLPETFTSAGCENEPAVERAEPVPGPTTEMAAAKAREHNANVICPLLVRRDGRVYNSAVVIDRRGEVVGAYEKLHPVTTSPDFTVFEKGVSPGAEPRVFELDFGRIGVLICFDVNFPAEWARLAAMGAEIVFWPSAYDGGFPLQARAWDHHYYVVSAVPSGHAVVVDVTGQLLAETHPPQTVLHAELNLERKYFHTDFNGSQIDPIRRKYGRDVTIRQYHREGGMTVESNRPGLTVAELMAEFDLEPVPDYVARHERAEEATRAGRKPEPQPPRRVPEQWCAEY
jgi:predicted amidohydrolase